VEGSLFQIAPFFQDVLARVEFVDDRKTNILSARVRAVRDWIGWCVRIINQSGLNAFIPVYSKY
jgi:hypothetical protein